MTHDPNCTGCPHCSALFRAIVRNPTNPVLREAMDTPALRVAAEKELAKCECTTKTDAAKEPSLPMLNGVPNSWATKSPVVKTTDHGVPDGWATAVAAQRGQR